MASMPAGEPISVTRRGRRVAVIIDSDAFDRLVDAAADVDDRRELELPEPTTTMCPGLRSRALGE